MSDSHGENRLQNYVDTHETVMEQLCEEGLIGDHTVMVDPYPGSILIYGEIGIRGNLILGVEKKLAITREVKFRQYVKTTAYAYQLFFRNGSRIFRYDDADHYAQHADNHHKHIFDPLTDKQIRLEWVGTAGWKHLDEVIREADKWYWDNQGLIQTHSYGQPIKTVPRVISP